MRDRTATHHPVVRPLRPGGPPPAPGGWLPVRAVPPAADNAPAKVAVMVAAVADPALREAVLRSGFRSAVVELSLGLLVAQALAPFQLLIVSAETFGSDSAVELVRSMHAASPSARLLLGSAGAPADPLVLLRALRAGVVDIIDSTEAATLDRVLSLDQP